ncbi:hypothetical protein DS2_10147 [Catenovulum agarivorans DS-2]|uniref:Uncharacterized protein n=1 Tax=Catenovulum agarivorans DS-2 TaxID=1328313 RepID=W7QXG5_9ALTE|nr:hypothetical protein [Catenovulum agarivorans]EWH09980.1 hypothetical protein DS2_10147 [Catenovulum agarivorans DS-2]
MKNYGYLIIKICALLATSPQTFAKDNDKYQLSLSAESFSYSEIMPVIQTFGGVIPIAKIGKQASFSESPEKGRHGLTHNKAYLEALYNNWSFHLTTRYDYVIDFTPDAAQLFFLDRAERPVDKDEYTIYFKAKHIRANGIGFAYQNDYGNFSYKVLANYWNVGYMEDGELNGTFLVNEDGDSFEVTGDIDYAYYKDVVLDRKNCPRTDPPKAGCHGAWQMDGTGVSLDLFLAYRFSNDWRIALSVFDAYNKFKFERLGKTIGQLDTRNEVFNQDGTFSINPSFVGSYPDGKHQLSVSTQAKARLDGKWHIPIWSEFYVSDGQAIPSFGIGYDVENWRLEAGYQFTTQAYIFAIKHPIVHVTLGSETTDLVNAKTITLNFGINYQF